MPILHPIFGLIFVLLLVGSYMEVFRNTKKTSVFIWAGGFLIILAAGLRDWVGADYPVYRNLFSGFAIYTSYGDLWDKALFRENREEIEWLYVLCNKIIFDVGLPFHYVTLLMALIAVSLKFKTIYENVMFPALGALFYFMPIFFFEDSGQMRQGIGIAICVFSFKYIKERNLWMFLLCIYLALGFHKTSIVFLPAYWLVLVPLNSKRVFWILIISILLSPFEVYRLGGDILNSLTPQDVGGAYTGYLDDRYYGQEVESGLNDIIKIIYIIILIKFDRDGCKRVYWYEYMRNLAVFGMALFYILRGNAIFAIRLPGAYMFFVTMFCMPNIVYAVNDQFKKLLFSGFVTYLVMMFFYFGKGNGDKGNFTAGRYNNVLFK